MSGTGRPLLLGERQKLRGKVAHHIAVERYKVRDPEAVEDREQQQRVFGRLSERFSLFDQQTCPLRSRLGFRRAYPLNGMSGVMSATCSLICSRRSAGVAGNVAIWSRARVN